MDANGSSFNQSGLTNDDFRKLLATSHSHAAKNENIKKKKRSKAEQEHRHSKFGPESIGHEEKGGSSKEGYVYRDRAEERRRGMVGIQAENDANAPHCIIPERDLSAVSLEESKYLGGDIEHTHLVKGLDYALLSQARAEREKKNLRIEERNFTKEEEHAMRPNISLDEHTYSRLEVPTSGKIGQAVMTALQQLVHRDKNQRASKQVATKRTAFLYSMKDEDSKFEIPTMRMRAEEESPTETDGAQNCGLPHHIIEEIARIMEYMMGTSKNKGYRKPIEQAAASGLVAEDHGVVHQSEERNQVKPADDDEDIFADAGTDYAPEKRVTFEGKMVEPTPSGKGARYFDTEDLLCQKQPSEIPQGTRVLDIDLGNVTAAREELLKRQEKEARIKRLASLHGGENDGYEECYPGFVGSAGMLEDSDGDDDDLEHEKGKNGVHKKSQNAQEDAKEKAKLESQLHNIQKIFEEKGYEHTTAFAKSEVATTESGAKDNPPSGDMVQAMKKKRRI
eukprot:jgi/Picsp_1/2475/NSC_00708-R1_ik cytokine